MMSKSKKRLIILNGASIFYIKMNLKLKSCIHIFYHQLYRYRNSYFFKRPKYIFFHFTTGGWTSTGEKIHFSYLSLLLKS